MRIALLFSLLLVTVPVYAESGISQQEEASGYPAVVDYYADNVKPYIAEMGLDFDLKAMTDSIYDGKFVFSPKGIIDGAAGLIFGCLKENFAAMGIVMMLSVLSGFMTNISSVGGDKGSFQAAFYVCFCVVCSICMTSFVKSVESGAQAIVVMSDFVKISAPVLLSLVAFSGQAVTATVFSPLMYSVAAVAVSASSGLLLPLIYGAFSLSAIGCIGEGINLDRTVRFVKNIARWIMGFFLTVFSAMSVVGNFAAGSVNAVATRTAKFAVGNFIPLVGGMLADSIDMIVSCAGIVKSAAGTGVAVVVMLIFSVCGIRLVSQLWLFRLAAAFTAPVADPRIIRLIDDIADCVSMVFSALCMSAFLFLIVITFMISGAML